MLHGLPGLLRGWKTLTATAAGGEKGPQQAGARLPASQAWGMPPEPGAFSLKMSAALSAGTVGEGVHAHAHALEHRFPHDCFRMHRITDVCAQVPHPRGQLSLMLNEHHCDSPNTGLAGVCVAPGPGRSHSPQG